ncbi:ABC transporter substrate-binding protein [Niabella ginsengisoli]|uniref:ABC transporter substrate-binding protein n=1 Tax=Niabella ginsengisoli TaxID=522298 RepID=A0ABS9SR57_9BACT|nr:ABC transporter substrate-binding protein [Niabella ginsengisoli]MCH5600711.1 ABC transporter substrate-binding protein [Niabella ginsengisoli]
MRYSKIAILIFLFLGIILIAWEIKSYISAREKGKIVLVVPRATYSISTIIALEKGFFANYGLDVNVEYVETGKIALEYLKNSKADFANLVETNIAFFGFDPFDIQVLCNIEKTYRIGLLARVDKGITDINDLKGKRIGIVAGSGSQIFLDKLLDKHGLSMQDLKTVNLLPSDLVPGIVDGKK